MGVETDACHAVFIECHGAYTSEVQQVIAKYRWLKAWLPRHAPALDRLAASFHWLATGKVAIRKGSPQERALAQAGLGAPTARLTLRRVVAESGD